MSVDQDTAAFGGFGTSAQQHFTNFIDGIYGTFATPAGRVCYLQTKARIGGDGSKHAQLARALVPAREALNIREMDFNQLLQRDLNDHRIATKLIPYILNPPANALPGFYPPVVACLLPFDHQQQPLECFAEPQIAVAMDHGYGMNFRMVTHGRACRMQYLVDASGNATDLHFAVLRWNPDEAKLVIMDGQHRAMSLLAIERTITKSWAAYPAGARYQPFYEEHVQRWLRVAQENATPLDLKSVELPVTICWFPEEPGETPRPRPHLSARKLFVDVNNTAKPPSEARLVLLSDTELVNILARELLNRIKRDPQWADRLPLYAVEYDNPNRSVTVPRRWTALTNLEILKDSVLRVVFGPPKWVENAQVSLLGAPAVNDMNHFMRQQLEVNKLFPHEFHDGPHRLARGQLSNEVFPINDAAEHQRLLNAFYDRWGAGILHLLSEVAPYRAHLLALRGRYAGWTAADNVQTLARDALFEGVGMFWTIEDGHLLWVDNKKDAAENGLPAPPQSDVSRAWKILDEEQKPLFQRLRAKEYLGADDDEHLKHSERLYQGLITYAAQVGLMLAWVSLHRLAAPATAPGVLATLVAKCINQTLASGPNKSRDRRLCLRKAAPGEDFPALNELPRLEPAFAIHYRYLWLELLLHNENHEALAAGGVDVARALDFLTQCRAEYLRILIEDRRRQHLKDIEIRRLPESQQKSAALRAARQDVVTSQARAHHRWFGGKLKEVTAMISGIVGVGADAAEGAHEVLDDEGDDDDDLIQL